MPGRGHRSRPRGPSRLPRPGHRPHHTAHQDPHRLLADARAGRKPPHLGPGRRPDHRSHLAGAHARAREWHPQSIAALAGLAPFNTDSGAFRGTRCVRGGRKRIRDALYMAAVSAAHSKSRFAAFYKALRSAGKPPKLAFIARARKLLVTLNSILRDKLSFQP